MENSKIEKEKEKNLQRIIVTNLDHILDQLDGIYHAMREIKEIQKEFEKLKK